MQSAISTDAVSLIMENMAYKKNVIFPPYNYQHNLHDIVIISIVFFIFYYCSAMVIASI